MPCETRDRINEQHRDALSHFQRLVDQLHHVVCHHDAFDHLWRECDNARLECIRIRSELDRHSAQHGC